jgi:hypothetical protein
VSAYSRLGILFDRMYVLVVSIHSSCFVELGFETITVRVGDCTIDMMMFGRKPRADCVSERFCSAYDLLRATEKKRTPINLPLTTTDLSKKKKPLYSMEYNPIQYIKHRCYLWYLCTLHQTTTLREKTETTYNEIEQETARREKKI